MSFLDLFRNKFNNLQNNNYTMDPVLEMQLDSLLNFSFEAIKEITSKGYQSELVGLKIFTMDENGRCGYDVYLVLCNDWFIKYLESDAFTFKIFNPDPIHEGCYVAKTDRIESRGYKRGYKIAISCLHKYLQNYNQTHPGILFNLSDNGGSITYL